MKGRSESTDNITLFLVLSVVVFWIGGIVVAKGVWSTFFSIIFAPYAWYLMLDNILI